MWSFGDETSWLKDCVSIVEADAVCDVRIDATGHGGVGVFCDGGFVALSSSDNRKHYLGLNHPSTTSSAEWELFGFLVVVRGFGEYMRKKRVLIMNDNQTAVNDVKRFCVPGTDSVFRASIFRELFELSVQHSIRLAPKWLPGEHNKSADAMPRVQWQSVKRELNAYIMATHGKYSSHVRDVYCASAVIAELGPVMAEPGVHTVGSVLCFIALSSDHSSQSVKHSLPLLL
jgi:hypothetical protein